MGVGPRTAAICAFAILLCLGACTTDETAAPVEPASNCFGDCNDYCTYDGRCTLDPNTCECTVTRPEDCRFALVCNLMGRCDLDGGKCVVVSDTDCRNSLACLADGRCFMEQEGPSGDVVCVARDEADCLAASNCGDKGCCALNPGGWCEVAGQEACQNSTQCAERGYCTYASPAETSMGFPACCPDHPFCFVCNNPNTTFWPEPDL